MMDVWASPPTDLLVEIFRRLDASDVVRCSCVCKPWRRAIIDNASSSLRPRPDRFVNDLLVGFFHNTRGKGLRLRRMPGGDDHDDEKLSSFMPPADSGGVDLSSSYGAVLSSRDGFLLLSRSRGCSVSDDVEVEAELCLCNPITGACTFLPGAAFAGADTYVLVTAYDDDLDDDDVLIVAVKREHDGITIRYQVFSSSASGWGPVKRCSSSPELKKMKKKKKKKEKRLALRGREINMRPGAEAVSRGGAIHWLGASSYADGTPPCACTLSLDARAGRAWTTVAPETEYRHRRCCVLATTRDGELSIVNIRTISWSLEQIQVWVLMTTATEDDGDGRWELRRRFDMRDQLVWLERTFCHRSGFVVVGLIEVEEGGPCEREKEEESMRALLVDVETGSRYPIRYPKGFCRPYEMDCSTYLSVMKTF